MAEISCSKKDSVFVFLDGALELMWTWLVIKGYCCVMVIKGKASETGLHSAHHFHWKGIIQCWHELEVRLDRFFRGAGNLLASHREPLLSLQFIINGIDLLFFFFDSTDLMVLCWDSVSTFWLCCLMLQNARIAGLQCWVWQVSAVGWPFGDSRFDRLIGENGDNLLEIILNYIFTKIIT